MTTKLTTSVSMKLAKKALDDVRGFWSKSDFELILGYWQDGFQQGVDESMFLLASHLGNAKKSALMQKMKDLK